MTTEEMFQECSKTAQHSGFWVGKDPKELDTYLAKLALITSEIGEGVEGVRDQNWANVMEELMDIIIRSADLAQFIYNNNLVQVKPGSALEQKMKFNKTRPRMHGRSA